MRLVDLRRQVQGVLPLRRGGTANDQGYARGVTVVATNREGASMALGSIVASDSKGNVVLATDADVVLGVVVGHVGDAGELVAAAVADGATAVVMTQGVCRALSDVDVSGGHYAFVSTTNDGQGFGSSTRAVGAFGRWMQAGAIATRPTSRIMLWGATDGSSGGGGGLTSPLTTKGDIWGWSTTNARVPVGSNGQRLTPDSSDAEGLAWKDDEGLLIVSWRAPENGDEADVPGFPYAATITGWRIDLDGTGSCVVDIWKDAHASYPPDNSDSITASATPTVSAATSADSSTLTGWTTAIAAGDDLRFHIDSVSGATRLALGLRYRRSA